MSLFSLCFPDQFIEESGVIKSHTITALGTVRALSFNKGFFCVGVGALALEQRCSGLKVLSRFYL